MNKNHNPKTNYHYLICDQLLLTMVFLFLMGHRFALHETPPIKVILPFLVFFAIWTIIGILLSKYRKVNGQKFSHRMGFILLANMISVIIMLTLSGFYSMVYLPWKFLLSMAGITYLLELFLIMILYSFKRSVTIEWNEDQANTSREKEIYRECDVLEEVKYQQVKKAIMEESGVNVLAFLEEHVDLRSSGNLIFCTNPTRFLLSLEEDRYNALANLKRINEISRFNACLEILNRKLSYGGILIGCVETQEIRKNRLLTELPQPFNRVLYSFDFLVNRLAPKTFLTRKLYYYLTSYRDRVISKAEIFGRLYSRGFEIMNERVIDRSLYIVAKKTTLPISTKEANYGAIVRLKRIGKEGKGFYLYKLRTMHPYAEYLQEYIYSTNHLEEGGKFKNDFRISTLGKWLRKYWIDEIPNIINVINGDMKLVGIRPLSEHYYHLYTEDLQQRRIRYKPGLLPPLIVDTPATLEEIQASEIKYLDAYDKNPYLTDWRYFWRILYFIVLKKVRSK
ncbi:MAG TPA: sugar transferase [Bacteroidales bacterium]|nr:sugar transferase [Bacteroidales bacterium]